jgi:O-antigen/teichoic acid export membrane protein
VIRAFGLTQAALAQRELRFRALAVRDLGANVVGGAVGIGLAFGGYGVWSLVFMTLVGAVLDSALLWFLARWRPRRAEMTWAAAAELWPYSSRMLAFNLFKALAQNVDRLLIGPILGARALGLYTLAFRLVIYPVTTLVGALGAYLFPRVARAQADPDAVRSVYRAVLVGVFNLVTPGLVAGAVLAPAVVPLLGERWHDAVPIVQILAIAALCQALMAPVGQIMKGLGRPGWLVWWSVGLTAVTAVALAIGARWGLVGVTLGYAAAHLAALPVIFIIGRRLTGLRLRELLEVSWRPVLGIVLLLAVAVPLWPERYQANPWALALAALGLTPLYFGLLARLNPEFRRLVVREVRKFSVVGDESVAVARPAGHG